MLILVAPISLLVFKRFIRVKEEGREVNARSIALLSLLLPVGWPYPCRKEEPLRGVNADDAVGHGDGEELTSGRVVASNMSTMRTVTGHGKCSTILRPGSGEPRAKGGSVQVTRRGKVVAVLSPAATGCRGSGRWIGAGMSSGIGSSGRGASPGRIRFSAERESYDR